jgi:hypothetical protein
MAHLFFLRMPTVLFQARDDGDACSLEDEAAWLRAVTSSDAFAFLHDAAEDIYTAEDGEPFRDLV